MRSSCLWIATGWMLMGALALAGPTVAQHSPALFQPPHGSTSLFAAVGGDTLRTNLWVAEALLGAAVADLLVGLPPPPAIVLLVPASAEPAANLLTTVATNKLQRAGYQVHLDKIPPGTQEPVTELRFMVEDLTLRYPETGRRLGIWKSWFSRRMDVSLQMTMVDQSSGQVLSSRRLSHHFMDRVPQEHQLAIESTVYPFTKAQQQASGWARRLEEIVVLGALAGLVAIYFTNTE